MSNLNLQVNPHFYRWFGLPNFAEPEAVRKAYKTLALQHHPDRGGDVEKMKTINYVYDVLTKHKVVYDNWLHSQLTPQVVFHFSFGGGGGMHSATTNATWGTTSNGGFYYGH